MRATLVISVGSLVRSQGAYGVEGGVIMSGVKRRACVVELQQVLFADLYVLSIRSERVSRRKRVG